MGRLLIILLVAAVSSSMLSAPFVTADLNIIKSPRQQMAEGIAAEDVICKSGLTLMIRVSGSAACVSSSTAEKLTNIDWGTIVGISTSPEVSIEEGISIVEDTIGDETGDEIHIEEGISIVGETVGGENDDEIRIEEDITMGEMSTADEVPESIAGIDISMAGPVEGSIDASVTIIEFGDYQCPKCNEWFLEVKPTIVSDYVNTGEVKLYFIDFPFLGDDSNLASEATYCADEQGEYHAYHSVLYNNQGGIQAGWASAVELKGFAASIELDSELFDECLDSGKYADRVMYNKEVGVSMGVEGTPMFFIIGPDGSSVKTISGPQPSIAFDFAISDVQ